MQLIKKLFTKSSKAKPRIRNGSAPQIVPRADHSISRKQINHAALKVLYGLNDAGFEAYLVGGCVRDLLLGHKPKDFDVATDASPEEVNRIFKRSRLIGRRFKLVHVRFGREVIEVATFRAPPLADKHIDADGKITRDNEFGTLEQDAWRRDFTINALYYNIRDFSIVDYTGGMADLQAGTICLIGDVETRYREDPVRMLRALRFKAKLGLSLETETERLIPELVPLLRDIPAARLFDESLKLFLSGYGLAVYDELLEYGVFDCLFPQTADAMDVDDAHNEFADDLIAAALQNTDARVKQEKPVTPAFLFAAILWPAVRPKWQALMEKGIPAFPALAKAGTEIIGQQCKQIAVPKRFTMVSKDIWTLQIRLTQRHGKRAFQTLTHPKFRAGYDFLLLRAQAGEADDSLEELGTWWTTFQEVSPMEQQQMVKDLPRQSHSHQKPKRRRKPKKTSPATTAGAE